MDAEGSGEGAPKKLSKNRFCEDCFSKESCDRCCKEKIRSSAKEIGSVDRVIEQTKGEVSEVRATLGWERVKVQIDSGAIDTVGPK